MANQHTCLAKNCEKQVPGGVAMCRMHWVMVPQSIQSRIWKGFRRDPHGKEYAKALYDAVQSVKDQEDQRRKRAAQQRHQYREALSLLRRAYLQWGNEPADAQLGAEIEEFLNQQEQD